MKVISSVNKGKQAKSFRAQNGSVQKTIDVLLIINQMIAFGCKENARKRLWVVSSYKRDYEKSLKTML
jgi:hypothetical protein